MKKNDSESKSGKFVQYLKEVIFYRVTREEKRYVKKETLKSDQIIFKRLMIIIFFLQIAMIVYKLLSNLHGFDSKDVAYVVSYLFLILSIIILMPLADYFAKKEDADKYFLVVAAAANVIFIWACSITIIDSFRSPELTTFAYVSLAVTSFILLEPWVLILDSLCYSILLICIYAFAPGLHLYSSIIIGIISISFLTCTAAIVNFRKKLYALRVKRQNELLTESLKNSTFKDELTKVYNRRYLTEHIDNPISIGLHPSGVLMLDIDHYKNINDEYGHQNGDVVLMNIGEIIKDCIEDIQNSYAVRYGGDEFLVFISHTDKSEIFKIGEKIRSTVEKYDFTLLDGSIIKLKVSIGASVAYAGINYTALINSADNNLLEAKRTGRNKIVLK